MTNTQFIQHLTKEVKTLKQELQQTKAAHQVELKSQWMDGMEVMVVLRLSARSILRLRKCGTLPYSKVHGRILYKRTDVENLLENNYKKSELNYCSCR